MEQCEPRPEQREAEKSMKPAQISKRESEAGIQATRAQGVSPERGAPSQESSGSIASLAPQKHEVEFFRMIDFPRQVDFATRQFYRYGHIPRPTRSSVS
jgi:hypothetical protein